MKSRPKWPRRCSQLKPAEGKAKLAAVLDDSDVFSDRRLVKDNVIALRRAFVGNDDGYAQVLAQTALEIARALRNPQTHGDDLDHDLAGWRRSKYPSAKGGEADMRLVFRARPQEKGLEILVFAHRRGVNADGQPTTAYHLGAKRQ